MFTGERETRDLHRTMGEKKIVGTPPVLRYFDCVQSFFFFYISFGILVGAYAAERAFKRTEAMNA